jgi:predicted GNAT family acetyltransferase
VQVERVGGAAAFLEAAGPLLLADEARHNLVLGLASTLRDTPARYPEFELWLVRDGGEVAGAALRTPPHFLVVARPRDPGALEALAAALEPGLPGVTGAQPEVDEFARAWLARAGGTSRLTFAQGVFALEQVTAPAGVPGRMRRAGAPDRPLLLDWWRAFSVEALHEEDPDAGELARAVDHRLAGGGAAHVLWEDGGVVVSLAGYSGATPNGIRVGPVYTPPELRGRGYASALVAELSAALLAEGRRFCFLYTDLANPTANRIYERLGYRRVCESASFAFEER